MRVTTKGQVTIPKEIRDHLGIVPGSEVEFVREETGVVLKKRARQVQTRPEDFDAWAKRVAGTFDTMGMDGKDYIDWLRGPRDDLDVDR
ncbi:MAG: AbrB/MazE/SpoVT family DNA-binding domain-containing protein [Rhizobiaceae bacterium]